MTNKMENTKQKMLLAALSQCVADRDKAASNISLILDGGLPDINENVPRLKDEFEKFSQAELTIESISVYYAKHFPTPKEENDNNS